MCTEGCDRGQIFVFRYNSLNYELVEEIVEFLKEKYSCHIEHKYPTGQSDIFYCKGTPKENLPYIVINIGGPLPYL